MAIDIKIRIGAQIFQNGFNFPLQRKVQSFIEESPATHIPYLIVYALIAALLPNLFFNIAFKFLDSSIVSILASGAEPTSALIFGLLVYQEVPTVFGLVGMVLVVGAIIILTRVVSAGK